MKKNKYFFTTVDTQKAILAHNAPIVFARCHAEKMIGEKLDLYNMKLSTNLNIFAFLLSFFYLISFYIKNINVSYKGIRILRYAIPSVYRYNISTFYNKSVFYFALLRKIYVSICYINKMEFLIQDLEFDSAYIDHSVYTNGVFFEFFTKNKIPIYVYEYPYSLMRIESDRLFKLEEYTNLNRSNSFDLFKTKNLIQSQINDSKIIPYLKSIDFKQSGFFFPDSIDYVIYIHSFVDAQMAFGYDGAFYSVYEWLSFTIKNLNYLGKRVLIKPHPVFYRSNSGVIDEVAEMDKKIFLKLKEKFKNYSNLYFLNDPIPNHNLLLHLDVNKTILISHHGNAILEGGFMGFKCICAEATPWGRYNIFNKWKTKKDYIITLSKSILDLKETDQNELLLFLDNLYNNPYSMRKVGNYYAFYPKEIASAKIDEIDFDDDEIARIVDYLVSKIGIIYFRSEKIEVS